MNNELYMDFNKVIATSLSSIEDDIYHFSDADIQTLSCLIGRDRGGKSPKACQLKIGDSEPFLI
mgnify:CR=1 FL=1